jgi:hypothetical protein
MWQLLQSVPTGWTCRHNFGDVILTFVPVSVTRWLLAHRDVFSRHTWTWGERGSRGRLCRPLPGGSGETPGRHDDRSATQVAGLGQAGADNARLLAASQEARLELSGGVGSLP